MTLNIITIITKRHAVGIISECCNVYFDNYLEIHLESEMRKPSTCK